MKIRARVAVYALLAVALFQSYVSYKQDRVLRQQQALIRQLWRH